MKIQPQGRIGIEICPEKCTGINLHSHDIIDINLWKDISNQVRGKQRKTCQCCGVITHGGNTGEMSEMVAHEVWDFDKENHVQRLVYIACVCKRCHLTIHYVNLLKSQKLDDRECIISKGHYLEVNHCAEVVFEKELDKALMAYRELNQCKEGWKLDITYGIRQGFFSYNDVNIHKLEEIAPGSAMYLEPYIIKPQLEFNTIPQECLVDHADISYNLQMPRPCEICGKLTDVVHGYYDLRFKPGKPEMYMAARRMICPLCRETIYFGTRKWFKKYRKTTKHYMEVNHCNYRTFIMYVKAAKYTLRRWNDTVSDKGDGIYIYLKTPYLKSYAEYLNRKRYLEMHGARCDKERGRWYLCPIQNLRYFIQFL